MSDTTLRIRYPTGATLYTQIEGGVGVWNGSGYVAFANADWATYATATPETPAGSGRHVCQFPLSSPPGNYSWATYIRSGASPAVGDPVIGSGGGYWDGTTFGGAAGVKDVNDTLAGYNELVNTGTVDDPSPAANGFAGSSNLASSNNYYRGLSVRFTTGTLQGLASTITGYNGSSRRFTFAAPFPSAPANGDQFTIV